MTWVRKFFKNKQKVWIEVDEEGNLVTDENGMVPMRYKNDDEAQTYTVHPSNIGADAPSSSTSSSSSSSSGGSTSKKSTSSKGKKKTSSKKSSVTFEGYETPGEQIISTEIPEELLDVDPPKKGIIEVYTDGACQGNPGPCSYGLLLRAGKHYKEVSQYLGEGTNNIGELTAILAALQTIEVRDIPVRLHTDSSYSIGALTQNWKIKANKELILKTRALMAEFDDLELIKVKGHAGLPLNERADTLAVNAIEIQRLLSEQESDDEA